MPRVGDRFARAEKRLVNGVQETFCRDCRAWDSQQRSRWYELHGSGRCYGSDGSEGIEDVGSQEDAFDGMEVDIEDILGSEGQSSMDFECLDLCIKIIYLKFQVHGVTEQMVRKVLQK